MKKILLSTIVAFGVITLTLLSCKKTQSTASAVSPTDANALQKAIIIGSATKTTGTMPASNGSSLTIPSYQTTASDNPGVTMVLPMSVSNVNSLKKMYFQVRGATTGYFVIDMQNAPLVFKNGNILGIQITVPSNVQKGQFVLNYDLQDLNGLISTMYSTTITITDPLDCSTANISGSEGLTYSTIDMGNVSGSASLHYDTYSVPDRIDIYQGTTWLTGTAGTPPAGNIPPIVSCSSIPSSGSNGFYGKSGDLPFYYNTSKGKVTVIVSGCVGNGTAWVWKMNCP